MEYRKLGKTGIKISALSFGSWLTFGKQIGNQTANELMQIAYEHGVNFFDNAEIYARGESEIVMGELLKKNGWSRDSYLISSKAFFGTGGKLPTQTGLSRKHLTEACHAALKRLQVDYLDLFFCHRPEKETPIEETAWTMHNLIQQGKILYWGTSEWSAQEIMEAHMVCKQNHLIGPVMEQPQYNMFHREKMENEFVQIFKTVGLGTTIWSPLASGLLSGKYNQGISESTRLTMDGLEWIKENTLKEDRIEKVKTLSKIAADIGMSMPQMAICWCLKNTDVSTVILGASKAEQLKETLASLNYLHNLSAEIMDKIEQVLNNKPIKPAF